MIKSGGKLVMFDIIIAEDDSEVRTLFAKVLRNNGYDITEANVERKFWIFWNIKI